MSDIVYQAALEYANSGLRVIPISPNSKIPPKDFKLTQYSQRPATAEELRSWFKDTSNNVAALMQPSGLLLVDVDVYKNPELQPSQLLYDLVNSTHLRATTPHGGLHYYYKTDSGLDTQGLIAPAVDTKFKGYALLPPSIVDGKSYEWIERGEPGIPPAFILRKFADKKEVTLPERDSLSLISQIITNGFSPGQHNEELRDIARLLARALNSDSEDFKKQVYHEILKTLDNRDPTPQSREGHFLPTLKTAWNYESSKKVEKPLVESVPMVLDDLGQMADQYGNYELTYLIDNWLPEDAILLMSALPETGKTWLLLDMAVSLAFGDKDRAGFMGHFAVPNEPTPVLLFQQEDFPGQVWQRMSTIMAQKLKDVTWTFEETELGWKFDHPAYAPLYIHNNAQLSFDNPASLEMLERWIVEHKIRAVFIDPLYTLGNSDNYFAEMAPHFQTLKRIRKDHHVSFVIAHHDRKSGGTGRERVYGSVLLNAASEGVIQMERQDDGTIRISRSGKFFPGKSSYIINFDIDTDLGKYVVELQDDDLDTTGKYDAAIIRLLDDRTLSQKEIVEELDLSQGTVSKSLTRLLKTGKIIKKNRKYTTGTNTDGF